jgi:hypothetical protein
VLKCFWCCYETVDLSVTAALPEADTAFAGTPMCKQHAYRWAMETIEGTVLDAMYYHKGDPLDVNTPSEVKHA